MFRTGHLSIIRSFFHCTHSIGIYHTGLLTYTISVFTVKISDNGRKMCPKRAEFYYRNKFEKLVHLFGFIIRIYRYSRSPERQILFLNKILWRGFMNTSQDLRIRHGISWPRQMESFMSFDYWRYVFLECDAA